MINSQSLTNDYTNGYKILAGEHIDGLEIRPLTTNSDQRGSFTEVYRDTWKLPLADPVQWSIVHSHPRVLRGMHLHFRHDEYFLVIKGRFCIGLYDFRNASSTSGKSTLIELNGNQQCCVSFPSGILHGWYAYEESIHLQGVSEAYEDYHPDDNQGVHWSDPELNIPWPDDSPIVAKRADGFPGLSELRIQLGTSR